MKKINKMWFILIPIFIIVIALVVFFMPFGNDAKGEDNVTMESFNALVERVEALESQLKSANEKISQLTNTDKDINDSVTELSNKTNTNTTNITNLTNKVNTNTTKITKIDGWYTKWRELNTYTMGNGMHWNDDYIDGQIRKYWETHQ